MNKVAVVILNWNGKDYLKKFLPSVTQYSQNESYKIIVADNGSTDESVQFLKSNYQDIEIIELDKNYGFAGGYNLALEKVKSEYYIILNSDIEVTKNWIDPIITLLDNDKTIAAVMPKIKSYSDKNKFEYAGGAGGFIDKYGYPFCQGRILEEIEEDTGQYDESKEIFWATGACLFIRSDAFHKVGGFDADFFAHMEEIDLCWRLKNRGYKILYSPLSTIFHVGGGTLQKTSPFKLYLNFRNNLYLLYKNLHPKRFKRILLSRMILDGIAAIIYLAQFTPMKFVAVFKAHISFYRNLKQLRAKRRENIAQGIKRSFKEVYKRCIVIDYKLHGKSKFTQLDL